MSDPGAFVADALDALARALAGRGELRNAQLATVTAGGRPALRTLVLRGFEREPEPVIETHSDARAGKVADILRCPAVALLAWSSEERLQLRFSGMASLHGGDALARQRWDALSEGARQPYGLALHPGRPAPAPNDGAHLADPFALFTVVRVTLAEVDVLRLADGGGQTRARGVFSGDGLRAAWVGA